ncbi:hypothetical protein AAL_07368 [Moelleriella libera RCEF 2490]|uniref:Secreted protein n=1 Tax=Moelleriella libera RCEF 2490 TaxID=1081109 RepID=A0A167XMZ6_9HYPO|nr:hypothetical protein AAL_07368 [Moelleriella libera RCEF 2490]
MKFTAAFLLFTSALALVAPAEDTASQVEAAAVETEDVSENGLAPLEVTVLVASPMGDSLPAGALMAPAATAGDTAAMSAPMFAPTVWCARVLDKLFLLRNSRGIIPWYSNGPGGTGSAI